MLGHHTVMRFEFLRPVNINTTGNGRINTEACSPNQRCRGKAISISYSECVFVALVIQQAVRRRCIILKCGLSGCTIFTHYIINDTIYGKNFIEHKMRDLIFSTNFD